MKTRGHHRASPGAVARCWGGSGIVLVVIAFAVALGFSRERFFSDAVGNGGDSKFGVGAAPFFGRYELPDEVARWVVCVVLGLLLIALISWVMRWSHFGAQVGTLGVAASGWAYALQWARRSDIAAVLDDRHDYRHAIPQVKPGFFADYIDLLPKAPVHVKGHPPLSLGTVWFIDRLSPGAFALSMVVLIGIGLTVMLVADVVRRTAGISVARAALPALTALPAVVWAFVSFDGLIMFELALACWFATLARKQHPAALLAAVMCGVICTILIFSSYGAVVMLIIPAVILWENRTALIATAVTGLAGILFFGGLGFWWWSGLFATVDHYESGISDIRPYWYFTFLASPAIAAISIGPAAIEGWFRRRAPLAAWAGLIGVLAADLSGMSKGEVERIWVPFMPWLATASAGSALRPRTKAALSVGVGLLLTLVLDSPW